jgi:F0F1-type ATP synthase gamma subunit
MNSFWDIDKFSKQKKKEKDFVICLVGKKQNYYVKDFFNNKIHLTKNKEDARIFKFDEAIFIKDNFCPNFLIKEKKLYRWG